VSGAGNVTGQESACYKRFWILVTKTESSVK